MDAADDEVKGLERLFPTAMSKALLVGIPGAAGAFYYFAHELAQALFPSLTPAEITLASVTVASVAALLVSLVLALELALIIKGHKHRRITQYSTVHPQMSWRWLFSHARSKHYLPLVFLLVGCFACGYYLAQP